MPKHTIRLTAVWEYDDEARLGKEGGFGDVFRGTGGSGPVAVKRLKLHASHAASRELSIGDYLSKKKTLSTWSRCSMRGGTPIRTDTS